MSRRNMAAALLIMAAPCASAQRLGEPSNWIGGGIALWQSQAVNDPRTHGIWDLGGAAQYRGSLEFPLARGTSFGVAGTYATVPLTFQSTGASVCGTCDANVTVTQVLGVVHVGGESDFHPVLDIQAGATSFAGLKSTDGQSLGLDHPVTDFTIVIGYGFGFMLSPTTEVTIVQDLGTILHARATGTGGGDNTPRQFITRLGLRYAVGGRTR